MTIPSRPAPAPPGSLGQSAASGANASIEQLRLQLQQQQQQLQQSGASMQRLTIKLPPPPKPTNGLHKQRNNNYSCGNTSSSSNSSNSSITRKFPQMRYTPATDWDDTPFEVVPTMNGNFKKVPPPRPPPPKVQTNGPKPLAPATPIVQSTNILSNIFNRKKSSKAPSQSTANQKNGASRIYGVSSGVSGGNNYGTTTSHSSSNSSTTTTTTNNSYNACNTNWNMPGGYAAPSHYSHATNTITSTHVTSTHETQLISFDSPPSSPTFTQKSNSDCVSVDSFSSDSNFSSPNNGSVSQPESGFEDDFGAARSRPATTSPLDPWEAFDAYGTDNAAYSGGAAIGTAPVRNFSTINTRIQASTDNPLCNGKNLLPPAPTLAMPTIIKPKISQKPKAPKPPVFRQPFPSAQVMACDVESPPMPKCAPPPPPAGFSLLDVISGKVDAIHLGTGPEYEQEASQPYGVALYDFEGNEEGDLSFKENEKIYLLEQASAEWYRGRTRAGCEGLFPANYIDVIVPLQASGSTASSYTSTSTTTYSHTSASNKGDSPAWPQVRSLYNFPAEVEGDLQLKENDLVTILYRINEDWLYGEVAGKQGQFPANFLEYVPEHLPTY